MPTDAYSPQDPLDRVPVDEVPVVEVPGTGLSGTGLPGDEVPGTGLSGTDIPGADAAEAGSATPRRARRTSEVLRSQAPRTSRGIGRDIAINSRDVIAVLLWIAAGGFVAGPFGAVGAAVASVTERRRRGSAAGWAMVGVALGGVLTLIPRVPGAGSMSPSFADPSRMWAARAAAAGAAALLVALGHAATGAWRANRPTARAGAADESGPAPLRRTWRSAVPVDRAATTVLAWVAPAAVGVLALLFAPGQLPAGYDTARLAAALGRGPMTNSAGEPTALHGPLSALLSAVLAPVLVTALALVLLVWAIGSIVAALNNTTTVARARVAAAAVVCVSPLLWARQTPEVVAAACVAVGLRCVIVGKRLTPGAMVWLGLGALARPEVLVVIPLAAAYGLSRRQSITGLVRALAAAVLVLLPWATWAHDNVSSWAPTTAVGPALASAAAADSGGDLGGGVPTTLPAPDARAVHGHLDSTRQLVRDARADVLGQWGPRPLLARSLRSLSIWTPGGLADSAESRGRTTRLMPLAIVSDLALLAGLAWLWSDRRARAAGQRQLYGCAIGLVVCGVATAAATYGDPALLAWTRVGALAALALEVERRMRGVQLPTLEQISTAGVSRQPDTEGGTR